MTAASRRTTSSSRRYTHTLVYRNTLWSVMTDQPVRHDGLCIFCKSVRITLWSVTTDQPVRHDGLCYFCQICIILLCIQSFRRTCTFIYPHVYNLLVDL